MRLCRVKTSLEVLHQGALTIKAPRYLGSWLPGSRGVAPGLAFPLLHHLPVCRPPR